jgi:hypothetical protein
VGAIVDRSQMQVARNENDVLDFAFVEIKVRKVFHSVWLRAPAVVLLGRWIRYARSEDDLPDHARCKKIVLQRLELPGRSEVISVEHAFIPCLGVSCDISLATAVENENSARA